MLKKIFSQQNVFKELH